MDESGSQAGEPEAEAPATAEARSAQGAAAPAASSEPIPASLSTSPAAEHSSASHSGPNPAELVIRSFVEALARLARNYRDAVREAGGIAPLVTLLRSGTSEVQALAAAVLRDLALDNPANRDAILRAGGLQELVDMVRSDATRPAAGEAAGALRALSSSVRKDDNGAQLAEIAICEAICAAGGIEALCAMVAAGKDGSLAPIHATGVLANLAQANEKNCEAILQMGGVARLVSLLRKPHQQGERRRVPQEMKVWFERASEEAANALWQLAAKAPSCNAAIRDANAIGPLVETLLRSGLQSTTANYSAMALVELIQSDEASKRTALDAIASTAKDDKFEGHGWSLQYPALRHLLQTAAEKVLKHEQEGTSASGIQYALDIGRAVEFSAERLDAARNAFDEAAARQKREKLSLAAEQRRKEKEEALAARAAAREEAERRAAAAAAAEAEALGTQQKKRKGGKGDPDGAAGGKGGADDDGAPTSTSVRREARRKSTDIGLGSARRSERSESSTKRSGGRSARGDSGRSPLGGTSSKRQPKSSRGGGSGSFFPPADRPSVPLHFIPRAQLLEKIERIAALNKAEPMPKHMVSSEATEMWHHRWDAKYQGLLGVPDAAREAPFAEPRRYSEPDCGFRGGGSAAYAPAHAPAAAPLTSSFLSSSIESSLFLD